MEFISISKKHSLGSSVAHIVLNILLVVVSWLSIQITQTPFLAIGLVLISKWRTFAVRPRYWWVNVKSNLVDLIFNLAMVILMFSTGVEFIFSQIFLVAIFLLWLLVIKPRSNEKIIKLQALLTVFFGSMAFFSISYAWDLVFVAIFGFILGYVTLRHVLSGGENKNYELLSLVWGMIFAEFFWILGFFVVGYSLKIGGGFNLVIPQASIILTAISFLAFETLFEGEKSTKKPQDYYIPAGFVLAVCVMLLAFFSTVK